MKREAGSLTISFEGKVALVTGAGNGLGRSHAMALASRGARVVVNDLGGSRDGEGCSISAAEKVVQDIRSAGGEAIASGANVANATEVDEMVAQTLGEWGRIDILINNAGILRDSTFAKVELEDFWKVVDVHLKGSVNCARAVWNPMREQSYGRVVLTTSASGLYGNFGQSSYGTAKAAMLGLMNVLHEEGKKYDIRVNALAPTAATRMTEELLPPTAVKLLQPETITPGLLFLASEEAPSRAILGAGAGVFTVNRMYESEGVFIHEEERTPETIAARFGDISDTTNQADVQSAAHQTLKFVAKAAESLGIELT